MGRDLLTRLIYGSILIVDAEMALAQCLRVAMRSLGHEVEHVRDPAHLTGIATGTVGAVVIALRDPLTSYLDAIRAIAGRRDHCPVLAVFRGGGLPADFALTAAQALGAEGILYEPLSDAEFIDAVTAVLSRP